MKITFLGAAGTVTGSSYILEGNKGEQIMVDMGMFQGHAEVEALNRREITFDVNKLTAVILTHAHLDHCGRLPLLYKAGYRGPIYMTDATRALVELSLLDSAKVAADSREGALYDLDDVVNQLPYMKLVNYHVPLSIGSFKITLFDAGHILGSASLHITNGSQTIAFSGDLGNSPQDLIRPTEYITNADFVVMESTYGDRLHPAEHPVEILGREIQAVEDNGGTLLIPSFSLERTQELLHKIDHLKKNNQIKAQTPVFLDSPMGAKATDIFKQFTKLYNRELAAHSSHDDPFSFPGLTTVDRGRDSQKIKDLAGAKVIIAGSGMMTGGRILNHAIDFLPRYDTRILFVGYQAEGTIGRAIMEGTKSVRVYGQHVEVNAAVSEIQGMSSHADQSQLMRWLAHIKSPQTIFLTHGEDGPRSVLRSEINREHPKMIVSTPHLDEVVEL